MTATRMLAGEKIIESLSRNSRVRHLGVDRPAIEKTTAVKTCPSTLLRIFPYKSNIDRTTPNINVDDP